MARKNVSVPRRGRKAKPGGVNAVTRGREVETYPAARRGVVREVGERPTHDRGGLGVFGAVQQQGVPGKAPTRLSSPYPRWGRTVGRELAACQSLKRRRRPRRWGVSLCDHAEQGGCVREWERYARQCVHRH